MVAAQPQEPLRMTETEYLAFEEQSETKYEFVDGEVFAMTGAGLNHNIINGNTQTTLNNQVDEDCIVVSSDMRLKVQSKKISYRYPDTMVICGGLELVENRTDTVKNPIVIIEVLSRSTAFTDLNEKFSEYFKIESVQEYVIISQDEVKIRIHIRHANGELSVKEEIDIDASIELTSIGCTLALSTIYAKTIDIKSD